MTTNFEKYYNFDLDRISERIDSLIDQGKLEKAANFLQKVENKYLAQIDSIDINKDPFKHLMTYYFRGIYGFNSSSEEFKSNYFINKIQVLRKKVRKEIEIIRSFKIGSIDYLELILIGFFNKKSNENLKEYIKNECRIAESKSYNPDLFFIGCLNVVSKFEKILQDQVIERKEELLTLVKDAKSGTLHYEDLQGKSIEENWQETIEECERELTDIRPDGIGCLTYGIKLSSLTNGSFFYDLTYVEIIRIKESIQKASKEILGNKDIPTYQKNNKLSNLFSHNKGDEITEGIKIQYKNIKGKRLKLLLMALQDLGLLPKDRVAQRFYNCCKHEFDWDIASYNAMNGYAFNDEIDSEELTNMKLFIETLIKSK